MTSLKSNRYNEIHKIFDLASKYEVIMFDIWGVLRDAHDFYPGVVEVVNQIMKSKNVLFVTNAPRLKSNVMSALKQGGFNATPEMIVTSGEIGRLMLAEPEKFLTIDKPVIYHLGNDRNSEILSGFGYPITSDLKEANVLIITIYRDAHENLEEVFDIIEQAIKFNLPALCFNPDTILYHANNLRYCAGHFALRYQELGGEVIYTGKPEKAIFEHCLNLFPDIPNNKFLMIGDTFATDILGSNQSDIDSALVLTGNMSGQLTKYGEMELLNAVNFICEEQDCKPTYIVELK